VPPDASFRKSLAERTESFCGADLQALCSEAFLAAVKLRFPQIFGGNVALQIDPAAVTVEAMHFELALRAVGGSASQRVSANVFPKPLSRAESLALARRVAEVSRIVANDLPEAPRGNLLPGVQFSPTVGENKEIAIGGIGAGTLRVDTREMICGSHRPRLLVNGPAGCGQVREKSQQLSMVT
jgi:hypothetical protein